MEIIKIKLADLVLAEENVRMHPKRQIEEYKRSLALFGQTKNAVIDEANNVLIGNGLVIAAKELGWDEIGAIRREDLSENQKLKLMVSDNKIFGLGVDNLDVIDDIFQKLRGDLDIPGYDEDTLKSMVAEAEEVTEGLMQYGRLSEDEISNMQNRPAVATVSASQPSNGGPAEPTESVEQATADNESHSTGKVMIKCPKCGDDIWLSKDALLQLLS